MHSACNVGMVMVYRNVCVWGCVGAGLRKWGEDEGGVFLATW